MSKTVLKYDSNTLESKSGHKLFVILFLFGYTISPINSVWTI